MAHGLREPFSKPTPPWDGWPLHLLCLTSSPSQTQGLGRSGCRVALMRLLDKHDAAICRLSVRRTLQSSRLHQQRWTPSQLGAWGLLMAVNELVGTRVSERVNE